MLFFYKNYLHSDLLYKKKNAVSGAGFKRKLQQERRSDLYPVILCSYSSHNRAKYHYD